MVVAVLGEPVRVDGYALAGAMVCPAESAQEARIAWAALPDDVALVVLTPMAAVALGDELGHSRVLTVVMPAFES